MKPDQLAESSPAVPESREVAQKPIARRSKPVQRGGLGTVWLTTTQAAAEYGRPTAEAFRKWADRRKLVPVRSGPGGNLLYARADIDATLARRRELVGD